MISKGLMLGFLLVGIYKNEKGIIEGLEDMEMKLIGERKAGSLYGKNGKVNV